MSFLPRAWTGEILRSAQKDDTFVNDISAQISDLLLKVIGPQKWLLWHPVIQASVRFVYYSITTLSDFQTLGEEYAGIIQVNFEQHHLPTKFSRFISVFLHCYGIIISSSLLKNLKAKVAKMGFENKETKKTTLKVLDLSGKFFDFVEKLNLSLFYINGAFYHFSKRLAQIEYAKLRQSSIDFSNVQNFGKTFKILGYVTLINLIGSTGIVLIRDYFKKFKNKSSEGSLADSENVPVGLRCPLCLDLRMSPTSTPCGHIFCWACIHDAVSGNPQCPICRETIPSPSRLVPIMNYNQKFCRKIADE